MPRSRRQFLQYVAATQPVALAGCTGEVPDGGSQASAPMPAARLAMDAVETAELPPRVLYSVGFGDGPDRRADLMDRILDGGATAEDTRPPLPADRHLHYDGAVYRLSREVTSETPATMYPVKVDVVTDSVDESTAVRFSDLPAVDREKFAELGLADGGTVGIGTTFLYTHDERDQSVLVPESEYSYIVWESGAEAVWVVDDGHERSLNTFRYAADRVDTAAGYGRRLRERFAFELADLSAAERDVVRTAIDDGPYVVEHERTPSRRSGPSPTGSGAASRPTASTRTGRVWAARTGWAGRTSSNTRAGCTGRRSSSTATSSGRPSRAERSARSFAVGGRWPPIPAPSSGRCSASRRLDAVRASGPGVLRWPA